VRITADRSVARDAAEAATLREKLLASESRCTQLSARLEEYSSSIALSEERMRHIDAETRTLREQAASDRLSNEHLLSDLDHAREQLSLAQYATAQQTAMVERLQRQATLHEDEYRSLQV
jgi:hypothetical protein